MNAEIKNISPDAATIALEKAEGFAFEKYMIEFLSSVDGNSFIPLGDMHDGGADGLY